MRDLKHWNIICYETRRVFENSKNYGSKIKPQNRTCETSSALALPQKVFVYKDLVPANKNFEFQKLSFQISKFSFHFSKFEKHRFVVHGWCGTLVTCGRSVRWVFAERRSTYRLENSSIHFLNFENCRFSFSVSNCSSSRNLDRYGLQFFFL